MIVLLHGWQTSRSKTQNLQCVNAGFIKHTFSQMEVFAVTCRLVLSVPHLISGSCSSPRIFGLGFLQTLPHDNALALLLAFGSASTWHGDFHPVSSVPCPAHTTMLTCRGNQPLQKSIEAIPGLVEQFVYARHGRELMGWKSPVREPMVFMIMDTNKSTSRRQGR
ncbi:MAG: hypothetical protein M1461_12085, partial [Nitrospirae bacterium]|nr:hypothetical protein [Nitrospirota bacterium]